MILGITGGTGCGKTTLLNVLKERGAVVLDCDAIYHELLTRDASLLAAIIRNIRIYKKSVFLTILLLLLCVIIIQLYYNIYAIQYEE